MVIVPVRTVIVFTRMLREYILDKYDVHVITYRIHVANIVPATEGARPKDTVPDLVGTTQPCQPGRCYIRFLLNMH